MTTHSETSAAPAPSVTPDAEPVRRNADIEEFTNAFIIHPISLRLTQLCARAGVTPNAVSLTGMLCGILAGLCYHDDRQVGAVVAGFLLMVTWHVMDGTDGQLARLTRSQSDLGKVLDGICDYVTFAAVYLGLALTLGHRYGGAAWILVAVAGACHAAQSAVYEAQRQDYDVWGCGKAPSLASGHFHDAGLSRPRRLTDRLNGLYMSAQSILTGADARSRGRLSAAFGRSPEQDAELRRRYRAAFAPAVKQWSVMSANYRTIAIFGFALARFPPGYFLLEIVGGSIVSAVLLRMQRRRYRRFVAAISAA